MAVDVAETGEGLPLAQCVLVLTHSGEVLQQVSQREAVVIW